MDYSLVKNITIRFFQEKKDLLLYLGILFGIGFLFYLGNQSLGYGREKSQKNG